MVTSVSPSVSGLLGGQTVTITGGGFDALCSNTTVSLGGVANCAIVTCTSYTITCIAGAAPTPASMPYSSSTGLRTQLWWNTPAIGVPNLISYLPAYPNHPSVTYITNNGMQGYRTNFALLYLQQVRNLHSRCTSFSFLEAGWILRCSLYCQLHLLPCLGRLWRFVSESKC